MCIYHLIVRLLLFLPKRNLLQSLVSSRLDVFMNRCTLVILGLIVMFVWIFLTVGIETAVEGLVDWIVSE
jgi:phosphotransferase system  glucose/maltose/N-acetylglucosamine-specific IIC component